MMAAVMEDWLAVRTTFALSEFDQHQKFIRATPDHTHR